MHIDWIDTFLDLCDTRSFNRTAERLGVTQSTISGRVKALEKAVGARLLARSRAGAALTTEGLRFEPHARALRHGWTEALQATRASGAPALRIGLQHDLADDRFPELIGRFREALPDAAFFFEADYSAQMCADLVSGAQDLAILFSPRVHPDLHFEAVGEVSYRMVSTEADRLAAVRPERYILANYSPAFAQAHAALHPGLTAATLSIGQNAAMLSLLLSLGGAAYLLERAAEDLARQGRCKLIPEAPAIAQTVFAGVNLRNRRRSAFRRLVAIAADHLQPAAARRRGAQERRP